MNTADKPTTSFPRTRTPTAGEIDAHIREGRRLRSLHLRALVIRGRRGAGAALSALRQIPARVRRRRDRAQG